MKAAMMSYCMRSALPKDAQTMPDILKLAAQEGIRTIELYVGGWPEEGEVRKAVEELKPLADDLGIALPVMGSGTRLGCLGEEGQENMAQLKQEVEACALIGANVMTLPIEDGQPVPIDQPNARVGIRFERMLPELVAQLQELADYAKGYDVSLAVLNHCFLVYLGWHQKWLSVLSERDNVGACVDPGNYLHYGFQDPEPVCCELASVAKMVRAGNVEPVPEADVVAEFKSSGEFKPWRAASFNDGVIDQKACYQNLCDGGYGGYASLKTAGTSSDGPLAALRQSWRALNDMLDDVG